MAILLGLVVPACQAFQAAPLQGFPCSRALHHSSFLFPLPWLYMCIILLQKSLSARVNRWKLGSATFCPALGCRVVACPLFSLVAHPILFVTYFIFLLPILFFFLFYPFFYVAYPIFMSFIPFHSPSHLWCSSQSLLFFIPYPISSFFCPACCGFSLLYVPHFLIIICLFGYRYRPGAF